VTIYSMITILY